MANTENNARMNNLIIEGARIMGRNFAGVEKKFNPAGKRNFLLCLPDDIAVKMKEDGWNVKFPEPREDGSVLPPYVSVNVNFNGKIPPQAYLVTKHNKVLLDEMTIGQLDYAEIKNVDVIVRPYRWETSSGTGIKGYLKTIYVTVVEDEFAEKYEDIGYDGRDKHMNYDDYADTPFD